MCGIIGFNFDDITLCKRMCEVISHRGPDDHGTFHDAGVTLGHQRLSIIDLHTGHQPIFNEDGTICVVYNGEIYNYQALRENLETQGHTFTTSSDTEVIVHAYEAYGADCIRLFNGMFAFALYDATKRIFFLGRDRSGIKPLHYALLNDGTFIFASEIKSILQYKRVPRELNPQALHCTINLRYIPGEQTMFKGIFRLPPAHFLIYSNHSIELKRYWTPASDSCNLSESYLIPAIQNVFRESVKRHMISDVPIGILLSGGIDSSSIVAVASTMTDVPLQTFCMGFGNKNDETTEAQETADFFGTDHHTLIMQDNLLKDYPKMIWYADEPKRNLYPYYISEVVKKHVKVVLGGLGGDELFGGYVFKYSYASAIDKIQKCSTYETRKKMANVADELIRFQIRYGNIVDDEHLDYLEKMRSIEKKTDLYLITQTLDKVYDPAYLEKIYGEKLLREQLKPIREEYGRFFANDQPFIDQVVYADYAEKMVNDFLLVDDRMNMAHSVESRVPFLDAEMVNLMTSIPSSIRLKDPNGKYLLKKAFSGILPKKVLKKEKQGFASSSYQTYLKEGREMACQILPDGNLVKDGFLKKEYIEKVLDQTPNPRLEMHYSTLWNILVSEIWYGIYFINDSHSPKLSINDVYA